MRNRGKKAAMHVRAVIKRILFIGFTIQIMLGLAWVCCNFMQVQDYGQGYRIKYPYFLYLLQMGFAFFSGYHFLHRMVGKKYAVWGSLALATFPFAMQCHLAVLPYSFMGSLTLLMFSFMKRIFDKGSALRPLVWAVVCGVLAWGIYGNTDNQRYEGDVGRSFEAVMARRVAWPTLWVDYESWPEEIQEVTADVVWEAYLHPDYMKRLEEALESRVDEATAKEYYRQITKVGWEYHAPLILRQIGWDILGYAVSPAIFRPKLQGRSYDAYTGRNYEAMRGNAPVLTKYYVEYGCWWFCCCLILALLLTILRLAEVRRLPWKAPLLIILAAGVIVLLLAMRGAGVMDYRNTIAVNELWLIWSLAAAFGPEDGAAEG